MTSSPTRFFVHLIALIANTTMLIFFLTTLVQPAANFPEVILEPIGASLVSLWIALNVMSAALAFSREQDLP